MRLHCWRPHNFPHVITLCHADPHGVVDQRSRDIPGLRYKYMRYPQLFKVQTGLQRDNYSVLHRHWTSGLCDSKLIVKKEVPNKLATMAKLDLATVWRDIKTYRRAYLLTVVASFGGMVRMMLKKRVITTDYPVAFWLGHRPHWWCPYNGRLSRVIRPRL